MGEEKKELKWWGWILVSKADSDVRYSGVFDTFKEAKTEKLNFNDGAKVIKVEIKELRKNNYDRKKTT